MTAVTLQARTVASTTTARWPDRVGLALGLFFVGAGVMRLLPVPFDMDLFASWGLPMWLRTGVGLAELTAGSLLALRRTRPLGAGGIFTIMTAAGTVHAALGHSMLIAAVVNGVPAATALAVAWATRRRLADL
jgi:uncharacterized membrane protein YphA (DoxX/SURF4 family)